MNTPAAQDNMARNEAVFREYNEKVQRGMKQLERLAKETDQDIGEEFTDHKLHFYCECSDENCTERIIMTPRDYERIHKNRKAFIVVKGHETASIERVMKRMASYNVVEKFVHTPPPAQGLEPTPVNNV